MSMPEDDDTTDRIDADSVRMGYVTSRNALMQDWLQAIDMEALRHKFIPPIESNFIGFAANNALLNLAEKEYDGSIRTIDQKGFEAALIGELSITLPVQTLDPSAQQTAKLSGTGAVITAPQTGKVWKN